AAARPGFTGPKEAREFLLAGLSGVALRGRGALEALPAACAAHGLVVSSERVVVPPEGGRAVVDENRLRQTGALALRVVEGRVEVTATRARARIWLGRPMEPEALPALSPSDFSTKNRTLADQ